MIEPPVLQASARSPGPRSLWDLTGPQAAAPGRFLTDAEHHVLIGDLATRTSLPADLEQFAGKSVLIAIGNPVFAALALLELDGVAGRIVLAPPGLSATDCQSCLEDAAIDIVLGDATGSAAGLAHDRLMVVSTAMLRPRRIAVTARTTRTEWALFTSGTTGRAKLVRHSIESLTRLPDDRRTGADRIWCAFYDIRRYGGLQILLRALTGGSSMVLSSPGEPVGAFLQRAAAAGVTHVSGTPSHWRLALASAALPSLTPDYVRLGGEICDQPILDRLRRRFPQAQITHAFASTETGVVFAVDDGLAGIPAALIGLHGQPVQTRIEAGSLRVRSAWTGCCYLSSGVAGLSGEDGFVDTGDLMELRAGRYYFLGRRNRAINVGGFKVNPESVEDVINRHPAIHGSRVLGRANPITGAIVTGELVIDQAALAAPVSAETIKSEILALCRQLLPAYQVPVSLKVVEALSMGPAGKLMR